jgi:hypothetical protein
LAFRAGQAGLRSPSSVHARVATPQVERRQAGIVADALEGGLTQRGF